jgi:hypothetical protein
MKKNITFLVLLLVVLTIKTINAQAYRPMLVDSVRWIVVYDLVESPWDDDVRWEYYALGDTLVDGLDYKKIYLRYLETKHAGPPFNAISPYHLAALMREDTTTRQVFCIPLQFDYFYQTECPVGQESMLYDFSLSVGDTVNTCTATELFSIEEIGVTNFQNIQTKYFQFSINSSRYYEGIGSDFGLFEFMFTPVKSSNLWQVYLEFYCPTSDCPFLVGTTEMTTKRRVVVYPNPAKNFIEVEFPYGILPENCQIELISTQGNILNRVIPNASKTTLPIPYYKPGIYLIRIWDGKDLVIKKIIIN